MLQCPLRVATSSSDFGDSVTVSMTHGTEVAMMVKDKAYSVLGCMQYW